MSDNLPVPRPILPPEVRVEQRPGGLALVQDVNLGRGSGLAILVGIVAAIITGVLLSGLLSGGFGVGMGAILAGFVTGGATNAGVKAVRRSRLSDAELVFPRVPLRLGEPITVRYSQKRFKSTAEVTAVHAMVTCEEWVRYTRGSDTTTVTHKLWEVPLTPAPSDPVGESDLLRGSWYLRLPPELPPSFRAKDNRIDWKLRVQVDIPNRLDIITTFDLPVAPEVANDLR